MLSCDAPILQMVARYLPSRDVAINEKYASVGTPLIPVDDDGIVIDVAFGMVDVTGVVASASAAAAPPPAATDAANAGMIRRIKLRAGKSYNNMAASGE